jgi:hypothetical protein
LGGPQYQSGYCDKGKNPALPGIKPSCLTHSPVIVMTELAQFFKLSQSYGSEDNTVNLFFKVVTPCECTNILEKYTVSILWPKIGMLESGWIVYIRSIEGLGMHAGGISPSVHHPGVDL